MQLANRPFLPPYLQFFLQAIKFSICTNIGYKRIRISTKKEGFGHEIEDIALTPYTAFRTLARKDVRSDDSKEFVNESVV